MCFTIYSKFILHVIIEHFVVAERFKNNLTHPYIMIGLPVVRKYTRRFTLRPVCGMPLNANNDNDKSNTVIVSLITGHYQRIFLIDQIQHLLFIRHQVTDDVIAVAAAIAVVVIADDDVIFVTWSPEADL